MSYKDWSKEIKLPERQYRVDFEYICKEDRISAPKLFKQV